MIDWCFLGFFKPCNSVLVFLYGWLYFRAYFGLFCGFMGFLSWYRFKLG